MNTEGRHRLRVGELDVTVERKAIKNLHLGVYPPDGRVRVAAPLAVSDEAVRLAVIGKLGWIKRQRARFADQPRQSRREMVRGETHYFLGRRHRLHVISTTGVGRVVLRLPSTLEMHVAPGSNVDHRERVLSHWYRQELKRRIPPLLERWCPTLGVPMPAWTVRRMKTRWGSCQAEAGRIWLNLELAKKPEVCLEYLVVHELVHFLERSHDERFVSLMDQYLPQWRFTRRELNAAPLSHESWDY